MRGAEARTGAVLPRRPDVIADPRVPRRLDRGLPIAAEIGAGHAGASPGLVVAADLSGASRLAAGPAAAVGLTLAAAAVGVGGAAALTGRDTALPLYAVHAVRVRAAAGAAVGWIEPEVGAVSASTVAGAVGASVAACAAVGGVGLQVGAEREAIRVDADVGTLAGFAPQAGQRPVPWAASRTRRAPARAGGSRCRSGRRLNYPRQRMLRRSQWRRPGPR